MRTRAVAGKTIREEELLRCTYYLTAQEQQEFKILCIVNRHSMTAMLRTAVQNYIKTYADQLPKKKEM
jgi:hypothetical protein